MADSEKTNTNPVDTADESVDDILASILNQDGSFNEEFNGLFNKYLGTGESTASSRPVSVDLSDRRGEDPARRHVEYEEIIPGEEGPSIDRRIEEKMPDSVRGLYAEAANEAQRPEFTSTGDVRYPTMGVGDAEERVVYDAEWEEKAKQEAARLERVRQDRMLRGDSTYVRSFVTRGSRTPVYRSPYVDATSGANPAYIDPLSDDDDFFSYEGDEQETVSGKKPFFPEGFSVAQRNNAADGRTGNKNGRKKSSRPSDTGSDNNYSMSWMQVDDTPKKKKHRKSKKSEPFYGRTSGTEQKTEPEERLPLYSDYEQNTAEKIPLVPDMEQVKAAADEAKGLRSTVAQIVDKYNRRTEEEEKLKAQEEEKKALSEQRKKEELAELRTHMSREIVDILDSEAITPDEYDDFSDAPDKNKDSGNDDTGKNAKTEPVAGEKYTEQIDLPGKTSKSGAKAKKSTHAKNNKKPGKNNRRRKN